MTSHVRLDKDIVEVEPLTGDEWLVTVQVFTVLKPVADMGGGGDN
jgi:hypothetical protein